MRATPLEGRRRFLCGGFMLKAVWDPDQILKRFTPKYLVDSSGCWLWIASINESTGYGCFGIQCDMDGNKENLAHRAAWKLLRGRIPQGLELDHLCRVRRCVNPDHLEPVPHRINALRGESPSAKHAAKTHCPYDHPYDSENTWTRPASGQRACRTCKALRAHEYSTRADVKARETERSKRRSAARTPEERDRLNARARETYAARRSRGSNG